MPTLAIEIDQDRLRDFCRRWKITEFALFGSAVRPEEFGPDSDVDVLVSFAPEAPRDFHSWVTMGEELSHIFGRPVDLLEREGVEGMRNYLRRAAILETAVELDVA
jgi:uncharacterized protein